MRGFAAYLHSLDPAAEVIPAGQFRPHTDPQHPFWYLLAAPELMALAGYRLETHLAGAP
jgi:hypothetical protein